MIGSQLRLGVFYELRLVKAGRFSVPEMAIWNNNKIFLNSVRFPILPRLYTRGTDKTTLGREEKLMCVRIEIITCRGKPTL